MLQGWFGGLLAALASEHAIDRYAITLLFVASVPLLDRAIGHYALMSHWIVLWALWLCLQPRRELATAHWVAVTCIASLVHAYLLYLVLALWVADVLRRRHFDPPPRPTLGDWIRHVTVVAIALVATMALAGYFVLPGHSMSGGSLYYGKYAANLNAFFNPGWGSLFLPSLPVMKGAELEGYGYLGARRARDAADRARRVPEAGRAAAEPQAARPADRRGDRPVDDRPLAWPWLASRFPVGKRLIVSGELRATPNGREMVHPELEPAEDRRAVRPLHVGRIVPVYPGFERHEQRQVRELVARVGGGAPRRRRRSAPRRAAGAAGPARAGRRRWRRLHQPGDEDEVEAARRAARAPRTGGWPSTSCSSSTSAWRSGARA